MRTQEEWDSVEENVLSHRGERKVGKWKHVSMQADSGSVEKEKREGVCVCACARARVLRTGYGYRAEKKKRQAKDSERGGIVAGGTIRQF